MMNSEHGSVFPIYKTSMAATEVPSRSQARAPSKSADCATARTNNSFEGLGLYPFTREIAEIGSVSGGASSHPQSPSSAPSACSKPHSTSSNRTTVASLWKRVPFSLSLSPRRDRINDQDPTLFSPLGVSLPSESLFDDDFLVNLSFSKRGSVMLGGQRALTPDYQPTMTTQPDEPARRSFDDASHEAPISTTHISPTATNLSESVPQSQDSVASDETPDTGYVTPDVIPQSPLPSTEQTETVESSQHQQEPQAEALTQALVPEPQSEQETQARQQSLRPLPDICVMAAELERESQKVRSLYSAGDAIRWEDGARSSLGERPQSIIEEVSAEQEQQDSYEFRDFPKSLYLPSESADPTASTQLTYPSHPVRKHSRLRRILLAAAC